MGIMVQLNLEQAYYNEIVSGVNKQLSQTITWLGSKEAQRFFEKRNQNIHTFWKHSQMRNEWDRLTRENAENSRDYINRIYHAGVRLGCAEIHRYVGYTRADRETLYYLKKYNYGLIQDVNREAIQNIRQTLTRAEAEGLHPFETAELLVQEGLQPIKGISLKYRARTIARTESRRARTMGTAQAYVNYGIQEAEIVTAGDDDVCEECLEIEDNNPYPVMELVSMVPVHPNCYDKETKLYTRNGWKTIPDVTLNDEVLTLNPETREPVFQHPIATIKKKASELVHIYNNWFETCVTKDHDCFIFQPKGKDRKLVPEFRKPSELNSVSWFLRTCNNNNVSPETVNINGLELTIDDFIFLSAWFLSEGSVLHDNTTSKKHGHPVKISQKKHYNFLADKLEQFSEKYDIRLFKREDYFELHDKRLRDYFLEFGYSHEKYVPKILFECSREDINKFLHYYTMGDGTERKHNNCIEKVIYTSSKKMRDDLSYLILLGGGYPSITKHSLAGTLVKHHNGVYAQNHDVYCIRLNKSEYTKYDSCSSDIIDYDDYVYCVEVPEYHTLWTQYNGKTTWNGNCRCVIAGVVDSGVNKDIDEDAPSVLDTSIQN